MESLGEQLIFTKSVNSLLFEGYNDTLLDIARKMNATKLPYYKFGWFYGVSETYAIYQLVLNITTIFIFLTEKWL